MASPIVVVVPAGTRFKSPLSPGDPNEARENLAMFDEPLEQTKTIRYNVYPMSRDEVLPQDRSSNQATLDVFKNNLVRPLVNERPDVIEISREASSEVSYTPANIEWDNRFETVGTLTDDVTITYNLPDETRAYAVGRTIGLNARVPVGERFGRYYYISRGVSLHVPRPASTIVDGVVIPVSYGGFRATLQEDDQSYRVESRPFELNFDPSVPRELVSPVGEYTAEWRQGDNIYPASVEDVELINGVTVKNFYFTFSFDNRYDAVNKPVAMRFTSGLGVTSPWYEILISPNIRAQVYVIGPGNQRTKIGDNPKGISIGDTVEIDVTNSNAPTGNGIKRLNTELRYGVHGGEPGQAQWEDDWYWDGYSPSTMQSDQVLGGNVTELNPRIRFLINDQSYDFSPWVSITDNRDTTQHDEPMSTTIDGKIVQTNQEPVRPKHFPVGGVAAGSIGESGVALVGWGETVEQESIWEPGIFKKKNLTYTKEIINGVPNEASKLLLGDLGQAPIRIWAVGPTWFALTSGPSLYYYHESVSPKRWLSIVTTRSYDEWDPPKTMVIGCAISEGSGSVYLLFRDWRYVSGEGVRTGQVRRTIVRGNQFVVNEEPVQGLDIPSLTLGQLSVNGAAVTLVSNTDDGVIVAQSFDEMKTWEIIDTNGD